MSDYLDSIQSLDSEYTKTQPGYEGLQTAQEKQLETIPVKELSEEMKNNITSTSVDSIIESTEAPYMNLKKVVVRKYRLKK